VANYKEKHAEYTAAMHVYARETFLSDRCAGFTRHFVFILRIYLTIFNDND